MNGVPGVRAVLLDRQPDDRRGDADQTEHPDRQDDLGHRWSLRLRWTGRVPLAAGPGLELLRRCARGTGRRGRDRTGRRALRRLTLRVLTGVPLTVRLLRRVHAPTLIGVITARL